MAILLQRSFEKYVALLGVGKAGAAFVPIDPASPPDRIAYITEDSDVDLLLTSRDLSAAASGGRCPLLNLDACTRALAAEPRSRPDLTRDDAADQDPAAYVIYTSGSSGRPKGVEVAQSSICNFLDVVPSVYDVRPDAIAPLTPALVDICRSLHAQLPAYVDKCR